MGKSYKKRIRQEKAKIKIKASKTLLPKGQNLTDTNFKVKRIVIKDQVKPHDIDDLLFRNKLNIPEMITRLGHHNTGIRLEALEGLKGVILKHDMNVFDSHFAKLLESIVKLMLCEDHSVRKTVNKLLAKIFSKTDISRISPFYPILNSYVMCGLTHIDKSIREDSLHFLDSCLNSAPDLCTKYAPELLQVCLDLVSESGSGSRTLSLNLDTKQASSKWRAKVLFRIKQLLQVLLNHKRENSLKHTSFTKNSEYQLNKEGNNVFPLHCSMLKPDPAYSITININAQNNDVVRPTAIKEFTAVIFPLLFDIFVEICPEFDLTQSKNQSTNVSDEDSFMVKVIIDTIQLLWDLNATETSFEENKKNLSPKYGNKLVSTMVEGRFPYSLSKCQSTVDIEEMDVWFSHNLALSKLVILYAAPNKWSLVIPYLKNCLRLSEKLGQSDCTTLTSCVFEIIKADKADQNTNYFISKSVKTANASKTPLAFHFFKMLCSIALDRNLATIHSRPEFESWLESLPEKLTKREIQVHELNLICAIAVRNFPAFSRALDGLIEVILDNLPRLSFEGNKESWCKKVANLLYWVEEWDEEMLDELMKGVGKNYWGDTITSYIKDIIETKQKQINFNNEEVGVIN